MHAETSISCMPTETLSDSGQNVLKCCSRYKDFTAVEELVDNCFEGAKGQEVPEIHLKLDQINDVSCKHYRMHGCHHVPLVGLSTAYAAIAHFKAWFCKAFDDISFDYFVAVQKLRMV